MDQADRFQEWQRNKNRPQYVREHREELAEYLSEGVVEELPDPDTSTWRWRRFLKDYKATVTRQLNPDNGESDTTDADEAEA